MRWPTTISIALWTAGLALLAFAMRLALRKRISGNRRALLRICCVAIIGLPGLLSIGAGGILFWFHHRSQPSPEQQTLFNGIQYERDVRRLPRPMVIHIVTIDLHAKGVGFLVTPESPVEGRKLKARTATEFLEEFHVQIAINANYFWPFWVHNPLHFYPQRGDPVNPSGLVASQGNTYSNQEWADGMVYLSVNNEASFDRPAGPVYTAINGNANNAATTPRQPERCGFPTPNDFSTWETLAGSFGNPQRHGAKFNS